MLEKMRLNDLQIALGIVFRANTEEEEYTALCRSDRFEQENTERSEALTAYCANPGVETALHLADEIGDCIITLLGVLDALRIDAERIIYAKVNTIYAKYNPYRHKELVAGGLTHAEAMVEQKRIWNCGIRS